MTAVETDPLPVNAGLGPPPAPPGRRPGWTGGRVTAVVIGSVLALIALGLLASGGFGLWADRTQRDAEGFITVDEEAYAVTTYALTTESIEIRGEWWWLRTFVDRVRIEVRPAAASDGLFVGIASTSGVEGYLDGVARSVSPDIGVPDRDVRDLPGEAPGHPPADLGIWNVSSQGAGPQAIRWRATPGDWTGVVMNADGSRGLDVAVATAVNVPGLLGLSIGLLIAGALLALGAIALIAGAVRRAGVEGRGT